MLSSCRQKVTLVDEDRGVISEVARGNLSFYDPEAATEISKGMLRRRISLSDSIEKAARNSEIIFVSSDIPMSKYGSANLSRLLRDVRKAGAFLRENSMVVILSAVPPGTTEGIISETIEKSTSLRRPRNFDLLVCKFIQGKIVIGASRKSAGEDLASLFAESALDRIVVHTKAAEALEYIQGCARAAEISCANELANLCEKLGIDTGEVFPEIGIDANLVGLGYGSSELASDVSSVIRLGRRTRTRMDILRAVQGVNRRQALRAIHLLRDELGSLRGKRIALLGLATDVGTTSVDGSRAVDIAIGLLAAGAKVIGYDRLAMSQFINVLPEILYAASVREALLGADGCIIQTADPEFTKLTSQEFDLMRSKIVIDGRRILSATKMKKFGVSYRAIGLGKEKNGA